MQFVRKCDYTKSAYHFQVGKQFNEEFDGIYKLLFDLNKRVNYLEAKVGLLLPTNNENELMKQNGQDSN